MVSDEGFIAAICAEPDCDTHRLVYADWLDDHGQPERAEFIRVQCALAVSDKGHSPSLHGEWCQLCNLRRRETELLEAHREEWCALIPGYTIDAWSLDEPMPPFAYGARCQFRRGFVEHVTCTWDNCLRHLDAILRRQPVREVTLTTRPPDGSDLELCFTDTTLTRAESLRWPGIKFHLPARPYGTEYWLTQPENLTVTPPPPPPPENL